MVGSIWKTDCVPLSLPFFRCSVRWSSCSFLLKNIFLGQALTQAFNAVGCTSECARGCLKRDTNIPVTLRVCGGECGDKGCFLTHLHLFFHQVSKINFLNPLLSLDWRHLLRVTRKIWSGTQELVLLVLLITLPQWAFFTMGKQNKVTKQCHGLPSIVSFI